MPEKYKPNPMMQYFKAVRGEMRHVTWPTRRQAIVYTSVVIGVSLLTALYLGAWDYIFAALIKKII
jgi:preprotein translocase subunit SecE